MASLWRKEVAVARIQKTKVQLKKKIAQLESVNDHLLTEVTYIDQLMRMIGFAEGIKTVKATANEMIKQSHHVVCEDEFEEN